MARNYQVDFFRGFLLILIATNHFISDDNILMRITREGIGWVTGASGFVFLSGFTVGLVYSKKYLKEGKHHIRKTAFQRAWLIYRYHLAIVFFIFLALLALPYLRQYWQDLYATFIQDPVWALVLGGLFLYQPSNLDILPMYAIFLLFVPLAITLCHQGWKGQFLSLGLSLVFYLIGTFLIFPLDLNRYVWGPLIDTGNFNLLSWQFIFFVGVFMGYLRFNDRLKYIFDSPFVNYGAILTLILLFLLKNLLSVGLISLPESIDLAFWVDKKFLRPLRLLNVTALFITIRYLMVKNPGWFQSERFRYLGRNSLEVFSFHILLIVLFNPLKPFLNNLLSIHLAGKYHFYPFEILFLGIIIVALYAAPPIWEKSSEYYQKVKAQFVP